MVAFLLKRLMLVLAAGAFVIAAASPNVGLAMPMAHGAAMASSIERPSADCPDKTLAHNDVAKMACGALACCGVAIVLPAPQSPYRPAFHAFAYAPRVMLETVGAAPAPDPFPPRPTVL